MTSKSEPQKVHTDALETLGTKPKSGGRDAVHIAVDLAVAGEKLHPGEHVGIVDGKARSKVAKGVKLVGIVDPFLAEWVEEGEKFWLMVYPRQITSLRHVWEHPDFAPSDGLAAVQGQLAKLKSAAESEAWLVNWCDSHDCPSWAKVRELLEAGPGAKINWDDEDGDYYGASYEVDSDGTGYLYFGGIDAHADIPDEFWEHAEAVLGKSLTHVGTFSCSC